MLLFIALTGCTPGSALPAPKGDVELQLVVLGYVELPQDRILADQDSWEDFAAELDGDTAGFDGELPEVDFTTHAVATHSWVDGGCTDSPSYWGWHTDGVAEMHRRSGHDGGCEAYFPQLDLLIIELGLSTSAAWVD